MNIQKLLTPRQLDICRKEHHFYKQLGREKSIAQIALEHHFVTKKTPKHLDIELLKSYEFLVKNETAQTLFIEVKQLLGPKRLEELSKKFSKPIHQDVIPVKEFDAKFTHLVQVDPEYLDKTIKQYNAKDPTPVEVADLFEMLLRYCLKRGASDIHINPGVDFDHLRLRIDGRVEAKYLLSKPLSQRFSFMIKERANIDLINVQTPQSGGFKLDSEKIS